MIAALKERGWTFNFIGANIDVEKVSRTLNIDNAMAWTSSEPGTREMYSKFRDNYSTCMHDFDCEDSTMPVEDRIEMRKKRSKNFFKK